MNSCFTRRAFTKMSAGALGLAACPGRVLAQQSPPGSPVSLNIIDVAGNLALTQKALEAYRAAKPNFVSRLTFTQSPAPELPAKIKAQQNANRVDIDLVLTGTDALAAGIEQGLWVELLPTHAGDLPKSPSGDFMRDYRVF
jgi:putative spermidine/putrescine transport system substrate-binding protein